MPLTPRQASRLAKHILEAQGGDEVEAIARGEGEDDGGTSPLPQRVGGYLIRRLIAAKIPFCPQHSHYGNAMIKPRTAVASRAPPVSLGRGM